MAYLRKVVSTCVNQVQGQNCFTESAYEFYDNWTGRQLTEYCINWAPQEWLCNFPAGPAVPLWARSVQRDKRHCHRSTKVILWGLCSVLPHFPIVSSFSLFHSTSLCSATSSYGQNIPWEPIHISLTTRSPPDSRKVNANFWAVH